MTRSLLLAAMLWSVPIPAKAECCQAVIFDHVEGVSNIDSAPCISSQRTSIIGVSKFSEFNLYRLSNGKYAVVHFSIGCVLDLNLGENLLLSTHIDLNTDEWVASIFEERASVRAILEVSDTSIVIRTAKSK